MAEELTTDLRACAQPFDGTGHIAGKYLYRAADRIDADRKRIAELEAEVAGFRAAIDRAGMVFINHPDPTQFEVAFKPGHPAILKLET